MAEKQRLSESDTIILSLHDRWWKKVLAGEKPLDGYTPITPHLYLTQVLNEEDPAQRERGMAAGAELLRNCKYILIGSRYGLSEGMLAEIQIALEEGITELAQEKGGLVEVYGGQQA